jgi:DNA helicase II / ATP-dependent DNA helicase PcrA
MNMNLNERQKSAVEHKKGALLIIAGAGTGKTAVLTQRILHIINKGWAKPNEILALTFTDKAADEMLGRVDESLPLSYGDIWISTFHSFCDRILRQEGYHIGLDTNYSMMSSAESYIFFRKYLFDFSLKKFRPYGNPTKFINDILKHFSRLQDEDVSPEDYLEYASSLPKDDDEKREEYEDIKELATVYKEYTDIKIEKSKIDFGDLIILTIKLFREKPNVLKRYRDTFKYILVDEFQDTNHTQNVLVNILAGLGPKDLKKDAGKKNPNLTVVGDDDQAIYKFRGAAISNILEFKEYYPKAKEVVLTENYRSRQEILDASYALIKHNNPFRLEVTEKIEKRLVARASFELDDDTVNLVTAQNEDAESEWVSKEILDLVGHSENKEQDRAQKFDVQGQSSFVELVPDKSYKFSDIAILVRANSHIESIVQNLRYFGIPYKLGGSRGLYTRNEIKTLIAFLRVLVDYTDEISMYSLLSMKEWGISAREFLELNVLAREKKISVFELLEEFCGEKIGESTTMSIQSTNLVEKLLSESSIEGLNKLLNILNKSVKMLVDSKSIGELLYDFVQESSYLENVLHEESEDAHFKVSNISKFFDVVKEYEKNNPESNIYEYVDFLNYSIEVGDSPLVDQMDMSEYDAVNVLTVHSSKGLEFPVVFLVNLVSDRFPSQGRKDTIPIPDGLIKENLTGLDSKQEHLQEERRLFYVGATRAKEKLYLTAANFYGGAKRKKKVSIFLHELLDRDITEEFDKPMVVKEKESVSLGGFENNKKSEEVSSNGILTKHTERFSYSKVNTYEMCPMKYYYTYVLHIPTKPSSALSFGSAIHNSLRDFYMLQKHFQEGLGLTSKPSEKDLLNFFEKNWVSVGFQSKKHELQRKESGIKMMKEYYKGIYSEDEKPYGLESSFTSHIAESTFVGKIDRMDYVETIDGIPVVDIIDYKTGSVKKELKNDLQLPLYTLFAEECLGVKVRKARYIFVEHGQQIEVNITEKRREKARVKLESLIRLIKSGVFLPSPGHTCQFCDYNTVCEDSVLS